MLLRILTASLDILHHVSSRVCGSESPLTGAASISRSIEDAVECLLLPAEVFLECLGTFKSESSLSDCKNVSGIEAVRGRGSYSKIEDAADDKPLLDSTGSSKISRSAMCVFACLSKPYEGPLLLSTVVDILFPLPILPSEAWLRQFAVDPRRLEAREL